MRGPHPSKKSRLECSARKISTHVTDPGGENLSAVGALLFSPSLFFSSNQLNYQPQTWPVPVTLNPTARTYVTGTPPCGDLSEKKGEVVELCDPELDSRNAIQPNTSSVEGRMFSACWRYRNLKVESHKYEAVRNISNHLYNIERPRTTRLQTLVDRVVSTPLTDFSAPFCPLLLGLAFRSPSPFVFCDPTWTCLRRFCPRHPSYHHLFASPCSKVCLAIDSKQ